MNTIQIEAQIKSFQKSNRNDKYEMIEYWETKLRDQEILKYNQEIEAKQVKKPVYKWNESEGLMTDDEGNWYEN